MKKLLLFVSALSLLTLGSCSDDEQGQVAYGGTPALSFFNTSSNLGVEEDESSFVEIEIGVTTKASIDRTFQVTVDPSSTATADMYSITGPFVIPANEYSTTIRVYGNYDNIPSLQFFNLRLSLSGEGLTLVSDKAFHNVNIFRVCVSDLAGVYNTSASGVNGFNGAPYSLSSVVTLSATSTPGVYLISDMSFGMYGGVYGDAAPSGRIQDICNIISGLGDVDQYNDPFTINGSVNSTTGVITLTWSNTYGDNGNVTLTPQ